MAIGLGVTDHENMVKVTDAGGVELNGELSGTYFLDENDMASDSDVAVASQQSIKKYVDDSAGGGLPAGAILPYGGSAAVSGYLLVLALGLALNITFN